MGKRFKSYSADHLTRSLARLRAAVIQQVGASALSPVITLVEQSWHYRSVLRDVGYARVSSSTGMVRIPAV